MAMLVPLMVAISNLAALTSQSSVMPVIFVEFQTVTQVKDANTLTKLVMTTTSALQTPVTHLQDVNIPISAERVTTVTHVPQTHVLQLMVAFTLHKSVIFAMIPQQESTRFANLWEEIYVSLFSATPILALVISRNLSSVTITTHALMTPAQVDNVPSQM